MFRSMPVVLLLTTASLVSASPPPLLQQPTVNRTHIVFVYAGDLWSVPREGGDAVRLTNGPGVESGPVFSPDGSLIAFTGEYDGNTDVFVMPAGGGVPKRLTWHPAPDEARGWTPDGRRVLFVSPRTSASRYAELFTAGLDGGFEEKLPLPMGFEGSYSPDGARIVYMPLPRAFGTWKRYRGGLAAKIWIATLSDSGAEEVPRDKSNDFNPMWSGDKVYFLSDRNGPATLFSYDPKTRQVKQLIENHGLDLKSASAGPGVIAYEQFGSLFLYDLKSGRTRPVSVRIAGDLPEVRERLVNVGKRLENAHISPSGARAVFEARGEIISVPAEKGDPRNLTNTMAAREIDPSWSPDGKSIAYLSDESGEYELHVRTQSGLGEIKKFRLGDKPAFYYAPRWSPDGGKIAYCDNHLGIWYLDLEQKKCVLVDKDYYPGSPYDRAPSWSPDSKWLAYPKQLKSHMGAIFVYSLADAKSTQITDGMSDAGQPVFDKEGKYLYFMASTNSGPAMEPDLHSTQTPVTGSLYVAVLAKDQPSPLTPESDEEKAEAEKKAEEKKGDAAKDEAKKDETKAKPPDVKIDFENIGQRILSLPMPARRYVNLQVGKTGVLFAAEAPQPGPQPEEREDGGPPLTVHRFDLKSRKSDVAVAGVRAFEISRDGEKMLFRRGEQWFIQAPKPMATGPGAPPPPPPSGPSEGTLKTEGIEVRVDPRAEWKQIYHEVWRIQRDFFYDTNYHGLDLAASEKKYAPYLESVASRADLNYLFREMLGEMTVGHMYVGGGDSPEVKRVLTGLLGADYRIENGRYRFARVYSGENWNPDLKAPLTQPGVNVAAGEYLLAVNGRDVTASQNVFSFFEATAAKQVVLKVGSDPSGAGSREVTVVPVADERRLRHLAWIEDNRRKVDQATGGRVAYVYMPDTFTGGLANFNRYFFAQVGKEAVIIDERFNGGGLLATDIVEILNRKLVSAVHPRDGAEFLQPQGAIFGPKVMIINEFAGSGGDAMPWYFKRAGAGKLIGKRTWGGLVGIGGFPGLIDGGFVTAPNIAVYNPAGRWEVENVGIPPDIEVDLDPAAVRAGHDPQLEKAIQVVTEELEKNPLPAPKLPAFPNYHK